MNKSTLIAYNIIDTGKTDNQRQPITVWHRIGRAWTNKDGSINLQLDSLPLDGKVHLREPKEDNNAS